MFPQGLRFRKSSIHALGPVHNRLIQGMQIHSLLGTDWVRGIE